MAAAPSLGKAISRAIGNHLLSCLPSQFTRCDGAGVQSTGVAWRLVCRPAVLLNGLTHSVRPSVRLLHCRRDYSAERNRGTSPSDEEERQPFMTVMLAACQRTYRTDVPDYPCLMSGVHCLIGHGTMMRPLFSAYDFALLDERKYRSVIIVTQLFRKSAHTGRGFLVVREVRIFTRRG